MPPAWRTISLQTNGMLTEAVRVTTVRWQLRMAQGWATRGLALPHCACLKIVRYATLTV
jgi:hypothetical protein